MLDNLYLTLLMGPPTAPLLAPPLVLEALQSVEVTAGRAGTGFRLTFTLGKLSPLQPMLAAGLLDPMITRVVLIVTLRGLPSVISDGVVTQHTVSPSNEPGQSTLTLTGSDLSVFMDVVQIQIPWPATPDFGRVTAILAKYAMFGIAPLVIPSPVVTVRSPTEGFDFQTDSDLTYITDLARLSGYTFYIEPGPIPLQSIAYFGPDLRIPILQPSLNVNSDWATNVESLNFSLDGLSKQAVVMFVLDPITHKIPIPIPVPNIDILEASPGARPIPPSKITLPSNLGSLTPDEAAKRAFGLMREGSDSVTGTGSLNVMQYGQILRARMLVGVRGAGLTHDGVYYVDSVTHNIKRGEYKQSFTLKRDGVVSQTPVVIS